MLTVGKLLEKSRIEKNISLPEAEKKTRVRLRFLTAIEKEDWSAFSSRVYIIGAIKTYASFLGIEPAKAVAYFRRDYEKKESTTFRKRLPRLQFLPETKKIVIGILTAVFVLFIFYFGYQFYLYFVPPKIEIISPEKRKFRNVEKIEIVGQTQKESLVKIFNEEIFPDEKGIFKYDYPLKKGVNTLKIEVIGANGKKSSDEEEFILE